MKERLIPLADRKDWDDALVGVPHALAHTWASCAAMQLDHCLADLPLDLAGTWQDGETRAVCVFRRERRSWDVDS